MVIISNHQKKKTKGRRKIEIKPIEGKSNLQVTFSKRRSGLIKKASELSLLCGAHVAFLTFSPGNKAFSFGHPNFDSVINRYLNQNPDHHHHHLSDDHSIRRSNADYAEAVKGLEEEKETLAMLRENNNNHEFWWENNIDDLGLEELEDYVQAIMELKKNVDFRVNQLMIMANYHHYFGSNYHHLGFNGGGGGDHVDDSVFPFGDANF